MEAMSHGMPMLMTWPYFADQFLNETLLIDVLGVVIRARVKVPASHVALVKLGEVLEVQVGRDNIKRKVAELKEDVLAGVARQVRVKAITTKVGAAMDEGRLSVDGASLLPFYTLMHTPVQVATSNCQINFLGPVIFFFC